MMGSMAFAKVLTARERAGDHATMTASRSSRRSTRSAMPAPRRSASAPSTAYLELHIEQAPVLDREGCDVGIVVGGYKTQALRLTLKGDTGHAGGTPMAMRRNALVGAGYVIAAVNDIGLAYAADEGRTTTTRIESFPNLPGTYAEQVKLTHRLPPYRPGPLPGDAPRHRRRDRGGGEEGQCRDRGRGRLELGQRAVRARMHRAPESTAKELGLPYREMRSQAGHDAYAVATMAPTAMIFTPCFEGISHNVNEAIELTRSVPGANLLLNAAVARANR